MVVYRTIILTCYCLLLLLQSTVQAVYEDSALVDSEGELQNDRMPYEPPEPGSGRIWEGHHSWIKHFVMQVARGEKQKVIRALCANKTKQQILNNLENWVRMQGPNVQTRFVVLKKRIKEIKDTIQQRIDQSTMLSEDAKLVLKNVRAIMEDMTITPEEELTQIRAATSEVTPEIRHQIRDFMDLLRRQQRPVVEEYVVSMASTDGEVTEITTTEMPEETSTEMETTAETSTEMETTTASEESVETEGEKRNGAGYASDVTYLNDFVRKALRVENTLRQSEPTISANMDYSNQSTLRHDEVSANVDYSNRNITSVTAAGMPYSQSSRSRSFYQLSAPSGENVNQKGASEQSWGGRYYTKTNFTSSDGQIPEIQDKEESPPERYPNKRQGNAENEGQEEDEQQGSENVDGESIQQFRRIR